MVFNFTHYKDFFQELDQTLIALATFKKDCPPILEESMQYSLKAGGKRLRPLLVFLATQFCGGDTNSIFPTAAAIEMIHTYSLIHDDLPAMDNDDLRRGKATNHIVYGEANAILAGDALLTRAFEVIAESTLPADIKINAIRKLANASGPQGMVGGQVVDLLAEKHPISELEELIEIHRKKTGRLIICALELGGIISSADHQTINALESYGKNIGLAFQVVDDILDCTSSSEILGKAVQKDESRGKATFPTLLGLEESRQYAHNLVIEACDILAPWGEQSESLQALAKYILNRDR